MALCIGKGKEVGAGHRLLTTHERVRLTDKETKEKIGKLTRRDFDEDEIYTFGAFGAWFDASEVKGMESMYYLH